MPHTLEVTANPCTGDLQVIDDGIETHNSAEPELRGVKRLCVFFRDEAGWTKGGAVGRTWGQCFELQQLWLNEDERGQHLGTEIMNLFEQAAMERSCRLAYLDTFSFQARPFYEKRGYKVVLETSGFAPSIVKYTMHKALGAPAD